MRSRYLTKEDIIELTKKSNYKESGILATQDYLINQGKNYITRYDIYEYYDKAKEIWKKEPLYFYRFNMAEMFKVVDNHSTQTKYQKYPFLKRAGIYGIYDRNELVYVGQSTNLYERWKEHHRLTINFKKVTRGSDVKYEYFQENYEDIHFRVIEFIDDDDIEKIYWLEAFYINKLMPKLNNELIVLKHKRRNLKENYYNKA